MDLRTGDATELLFGGFLAGDGVSGVGCFVYPESDSSLLMGAAGYLVRLSLDAGQQSLVASFEPQRVLGALVSGSEIVVLLDQAGIVGLDPVLGPTLLSIHGGTSFGLLADGTFALLHPPYVARIDSSQPYQQLTAQDLLFNGQSTGIDTDAILVAPAPEPAGGQLIALLALAGIARCRRQQSR
jgi:hypothetical protein